MKKIKIKDTVYVTDHDLPICFGPFSGSLVHLANINNLKKEPFAVIPTALIHEDEVHDELSELVKGEPNILIERDVHGTESVWFREDWEETEHVLAALASCHVLSESDYSEAEFEFLKNDWSESCESELLEGIDEYTGDLILKMASARPGEMTDFLYDIFSDFYLDYPESPTVDGRCAIFPDADRALDFARKRLNNLGLCLIEYKDIGLFRTWYEIESDANNMSPQRGYSLLCDCIRQEFLPGVEFLFSNNMERTASLFESPLDLAKETKNSELIATVECLILRTECTPKHSEVESTLGL